MIARAAGINDIDKNTKIALASATFFMDTTQPADTTGQFSRWLLIGAIAAAVLVLLLILLVFLLRRRKKKAQEAALAEVQLTETVVVPPAAEAIQESEDEKASKELLRIQNEKSMELKENIRKFALNWISHISIRTIRYEQQKIYRNRPLRWMRRPFIGTLSGWMEWCVCC